MTTLRRVLVLLPCLTAILVAEDAVPAPQPPEVLLQMGSSGFRGGEGMPLQVAISRDGKFLATGESWGGHVRVFDTKTGATTVVLRCGDGPILNIFFSGDSTRIAACGFRTDLFVWETATGKEVKHFAPGTAKVSTMALSPDGASIALTGDESKVHVFDVEGGIEKGTFEGHGAKVVAIAWAPAGKSVASVDAAGKLFLWGASNGKSLFDGVAISEKPLTAVTWAPDARTLVVCGENYAGIRSAADGSETLRIKVEGTEPYLGAAFTPDGKRIAVLMSDTISLQDPAGAEPSHEFGSRRVSRLGWSADGSTILGGSKMGPIVRIEAKTGEDRVPEGHTGDVFCVAFSPDGKLVASGSLDNDVRVWEVATGKCLTRMKGHERAVDDVAWSPDGKLIASVGSDGTARVWEVAKATEVHKMSSSAGRDPMSKAFTSLAFSPSGDRLALGDVNGVVEIWKTATWEKERSMTCPVRNLDFVTWSGDGKIVGATSSQCTATAWIVESGEEVGRVRPMVQNFVEFHFSESGDTITAVCTDQSLHRWTTKGGKEELSVRSKWSGGCGGTFSRDGAVIAVSGGATVWVIDKSGAALGTLSWPDHGMSAHAFSPDASLLAAGCRDGSIIIWRVPGPK